MSLRGAGCLYANALIAISCLPLRKERIDCHQNLPRLPYEQNASIAVAIAARALAELLPRWKTRRWPQRMTGRTSVPGRNSSGIRTTTMQALSSDLGPQGAAAASRTWRDVCLCFRDHDFAAWFSRDDIADMRQVFQDLVWALKLPTGVMP